MMTFLLLSLASFFLASVVVVSDFRFTKKKEESVTEENKEATVSGHDALIIATFALLRIGKRKFLHIKRLLFAYVLHVFVRLLRFFDKVSFALYVKSRNLFIKNAVKNKGTVPFFWEYLKTYKQEVDREREILLKEEEE